MHSNLQNECDKKTQEKKYIKFTIHLNAAYGVHFAMYIFAHLSF